MHGVGNMNTSVLGAVLAGGGSRRMGRHKASLPFHGRPLIQSVIDPLKSIFANVVIVTNQRQSYEFLKLPVLADIIPECGPLGGLYTALTHGNGRPLFAVACDLPLISPELIRYILDFAIPKESSPELSESVPVAKIPVQQGRLHPLCGWYSGSCLSVIEQNLKQRQLKVLDFLQQIRTVPVPVTPEQSVYRKELLSNINTEEQYQHLLDTY